MIDETELSCSFCGEPANKVSYLVKEKDVQICDACVRICVDAINEYHGKRQLELAMQMVEAHPS